jgi:SpoIID/LytB domain protein
VDKSKDYDVVDPTNDQVFKGVNLNDATAIRAVKETAGMVGMYKGKLASCYYSASNGGQTELVQNVWSGRGDWDYYRMVDDPYDLENPESIVRKARIAKNGQVKEEIKGMHEDKRKQEEYIKELNKEKSNLHDKLDKANSRAAINKLLKCQEIGCAHRRPPLGEGAADTFRQIREGNLGEE